MSGAQVNLESAPSDCQGAIYQATDSTRGAVHTIIMHMYMMILLLVMTINVKDNSNTRFRFVLGSLIRGSPNQQPHHNGSSSAVVKK